MAKSDSSRMITAGVVLAFLLLIAGVWASDLSTATSLGLTGLLVLVGVGTLVTFIPDGSESERADEQRERMKQTTP